jgi:hypothetical protein
MFYNIFFKYFPFIESLFYNSLYTTETLIGCTACWALVPILIIIDT